MHKGVKGKQMTSEEDEIEYRDKRRSSRIIALEERKRQQKERGLELESQRKNNSINHDARNKGKGKATMEEYDDLCNNINEVEERSTKKRRKNKEFYQLISSIKVCLYNFEYFKLVKHNIRNVTPKIEVFHTLFC